MIVAVFLKNAAAGCLSFSCRLHVFVFDVIVCKVTENLPKPLFFLEKQFVFTEKTICFQLKNNLFSLEKQFVFAAKTKRKQYGRQFSWLQSFAFYASKQQKKKQPAISLSRENGWLRCCCYD